MDATGRTLRWLFGEEGSVATERELQVVVIATAATVTGVFVVSPIVSQLSGPFGVTDAQAGQLVTAFVAPSIVLVPAMGMLADRMGRKPILVTGLLVFGVAGAAIAAVPSFPVVMGLRAIQGIGYAAIIPVTVAMLGDLYSGEREATAQGLRVAGIQAVNLVSPPLAGVLVLASWRYPFLLYALAVLIAAWAWVALPDVEPAGATSIRAYAADLASSLARPAMAMVMLTFAVRFVLTFAFFAYVSVLVGAALGGSAVASGLLVSGYGLVSLVASTQVGRMTSAWDIVLVTLAGFVIAGIGMTLMGAVPSTAGLVVGAVLLGFGGGVTGPVQKSLVTQYVPASKRAGAVSSSVVLQSVGQAVGPLLMGLVIARYPVTLGFVGFGIVFGGLGAALLAGAYVLGDVAEEGSPAAGN